MTHIPKFNPEQTLFIVFGIVLIFIGIPIAFICGCCNHDKNDNVSNNKIIKDYP